MHVLTQYSDTNGVVKLPPGVYPLSETIHDTIHITSEDPSRPASIINKTDNPCLQLFGEDSVVDTLAFDGEGKALSLRGKNQTAIRNIHRGNETAVLSEFAATIVFNNIMYFRQDAIRFCSDDTLISHNIIGMLNPSYWEGSHKDCIQAYAGELGSPLRHLNRYTGEHILRGAIITNNVMFDHPGSPLQGIFMADGRPENWLVSNNTIQLFSHHGITLRGSKSNTLKDNFMIGTAKINLLPARSLIEMSTPVQGQEPETEWVELNDAYTCRVGETDLCYIGENRQVELIKSVA